MCFCCGRLSSGSHNRPRVVESDCVFFHCHTDSGTAQVDIYSEFCEEASQRNWGCFYIGGIRDMHWTVSMYMTC